MWFIPQRFTLAALKKVIPASRSFFAGRNSL